MRNFLVLLLSISICTLTQAQSFHFGPKAGGTIAVQQWNNLERDPLFAYHGAVFIETLDPSDEGSLYAQFGYHKRGSGVRVFDFLTSFSQSQSFQFNNLVLALGTKRRINRSESKVFFYNFAIRGEYTLNTNLSNFENFNSLFYPIDQFVRKFNYGLSFGGGIEFGSSKFSVPFIELTISPDISLQYMQNAIPNVINPFNGQTTTLPERNIRNLTLELTFGMKFLREVIYVD